MTSIAYHPRPSLPARSLRVAAIVILVAIAIVMTFAITSVALAGPMVGLAVFVLIAYAAFRWPTQTVVATLILIPLSRFTSLLIFSATGSVWAVRANQLVKDELIIVLLIAVANQAFRRRSVPTLYLFDIVIAAYASLTLLYLFYPGASGYETNALASVLAWRQDALYFLAYFIGRGMTLDRRILRLMLHVLVGLSVVLGIVALLQFALPGLSNAAFNYLGFDRFMAVIGAPHETLVVRDRGIPGADFPRASSLFLADLGLAFFQVLIIPFAAALFYLARRRTEQFGYGMFLVLMIAALAATVTRSAVVAAAVGMCAVTVHTAAYLRAWTVAVSLVALSLPAIIVMGVSPDSIRALTSVREGSATAHMSLLTEGLAQLREYPLGLGLGHGSHVANLVSNFGVNLSVSSTESWYMQLALEMGIAAVALFSLMLLMATGKAALTSFHVTDPLLKVVTVGVAGAGLSLVVLGLLQPVWAAVHVSYLFWLFAGIAARASTLERQWHDETKIAPKLSPDAGRSGASES
jgi:hypothetical protein